VFRELAGIGATPAARASLGGRRERVLRVHSTLMSASRRQARGRGKSDSIDALDQKPLQRARNMPAVLQRPHAFRAELARPPQQRRGALRTRLDGLLAEQLTGRRTNRGDRVRPLVSVRTEHDH